MSDTQNNEAPGYIHSSKQSNTELYGAKFASNGELLHSNKISTHSTDPFVGGLPGTKASDMQIGGDHYKKMKIQPGDFIYKNGLNWFEGNAIKYICRHKLKHGRQDIEKAIHYLNLLLEHEYGE